MLSPIALLLLLLAALSAAAPVAENQTSAAIFERATWGAVCKSPNNWQHSYTWSYVTETLALLRQNMNKPCKKSFAKDETHKYKPVHVAQDGSGDYKCYPAHFVTTTPNPSPEVIAELHKIPGCQPRQRGKDFIEFPITNGYYKKGNPGPHRILAIADYDRQTRLYSNPKYCLTMAHEELGGGKFVFCEGGQGPPSKS